MTHYEKIVASLALSRRAAELGLPQDGALFYWEVFANGSQRVITHSQRRAKVQNTKSTFYAAWTEAETLGRLPVEEFDRMGRFRYGQEDGSYWRIWYTNDGSREKFDGDTLADAALSMECWLAEQKLLPSA